MLTGKEGTTVYYNVSNPSEMVVSTPIENVAKKRLKGRFALCFNALFEFVKEDSKYGPLVMHIVENMDRNNYYNASVREIALAIGEHEDRVGKKLKHLASKAIIHKDKKNILFNPAYAIKGDAEKQAEIAQNWYNGIFKPYVEDDTEEQKKELQISIKKAKELTEKLQQQILLADGAAT